MRPSEQLAGLELDGGWKVLHCASRHPKATGGHFSTGYIVENVDGRRGFLKALDYSSAFSQPNTAELLQAMTQAYLFERAICERCRELRMRRIVHAIATGAVTPGSDVSSKVEYLIFELADGDVRDHLQQSANFDLAFCLRALHHVATGLQQLHQQRIAHQDLKPSNVLVFAGKEGSKIGDLGRAWSRDTPSPHDGFPVPGDLSYAPPESIYGTGASTSEAQRFAADTYHFGSLILFMFKGVHANALLIDRLAPEHRPVAWRGSYDEVLPFIRQAFGQVVSEIQAEFEGETGRLIGLMITELCEPDPRRRGHPKEQGVGQYSLHRYVSQLDLLATRAEWGLTRYGRARGG